jgi:hypothetical protein
VSGKARLTKSVAKSTAKRQSAKAAGNLQAYKCRACGGWHVGNLRRFEERLPRDFDPGDPLGPFAEQDDEADRARSGRYEHESPQTDQWERA